MSSHEKRKAEATGLKLSCVFMFGKVGVFQLPLQLPGLEGHRKDGAHRPSRPEFHRAALCLSPPGTVCLLLLFSIEGICMKIGFPLSSRAPLPAAVSHLKL